MVVPEEIPPQQLEDVKTPNGGETETHYKKTPQKKWPKINMGNWGQ